MIVEVQFNFLLMFLLLQRFYCFHIPLLTSFPLYLIIFFVQFFYMENIAYLFHWLWLLRKLACSVGIKIWRLWDLFRAIEQFELQNSFALKIYVLQPDTDNRAFHLSFRLMIFILASIYKAKRWLFMDVKFTRLS